MSAAAWLFLMMSLFVALPAAAQPRAGQADPIDDVVERLVQRAKEAKERVRMARGDTAPAGGGKAEAPRVESTPVATAPPKADALRVALFRDVWEHTEPDPASPETHKYFDLRFYPSAQNQGDAAVYRRSMQNLKLSVSDDSEPQRASWEIKGPDSVEVRNPELGPATYALTQVNSLRRTTDSQAWPQSLGNRKLTLDDLGPLGQAGFSLEDTPAK